LDVDRLVRGSPTPRRWSKRGHGPPPGWHGCRRGPCDASAPITVCYPHPSSSSLGTDGSGSVMPGRPATSYLSVRTAFPLRSSVGNTVTRRASCGFARRAEHIRPQLLACDLATCLFFDVGAPLGRDPPYPIAVTPDGHLRTIESGSQPTPCFGTTVLVDPPYECLWDHVPLRLHVHHTSMLRGVARKCKAWIRFVDLAWLRYFVYHM